ncbi:hypothetical protein OSB04_016035 [Centaurea solstitialis]|uniref:MATH domain-containing protein n=1 Tax=Centaurea solstitialis TaxID=347529 RepID=A0AA38WH26_9ASTR|nr:hypothetical protein OSB04_016035 [Centaurea solstitialis]
MDDWIGMFISKRKNEPCHYMLKIESFSILCEAPTTNIESDVFEASEPSLKPFINVVQGRLLTEVKTTLKLLEKLFKLVNTKENLLRRLDLYPEGNEEEKGANHISLYLIICCTESLPKGWEVCVDVNFFIYDHIQHNYASFQDIVNGNRIRFHEKKLKWGFDKLISLDSFKKSENGYLVNDSCVFGAEVAAQKDRILSMIKPPKFMRTHTWTIENFLTITEKVVYSEIFRVGNVHDAASLPDGWRAYANFILRLKNQNDNNIEKGSDKWLNSLQSDWGFRSFMPLKQLEDPANGFLLNGSLTVEADILSVGTFRNFI